jgi:ABC-type multidrug transport system fused ATPase/permease subunit
LGIFSVDAATEKAMQEVIDQELSNRTIITIIHRFGYVHRFDRVAVLQGGELVECDTPKALLSKDSIFRGLYTASMEQPP